MKEGTILRRRCPFPLITHVGILIYNDGQPVVYHNTAIKKNDFGGNIVAMPLEEFLSIGKLISTTETDINPDFVRDFSYSMRFQKYKALSYNCEDFINQLLTGKKGSRQRKNWLWGTGLAAIGFGIYQVNKK